MQASRPHRPKALAPIEAGSPLAFEAAKAESGTQSVEQRVKGRAPKKKKTFALVFPFEARRLNGFAAYLCHYESEFECR